MRARPAALALAVLLAASLVVPAGAAQSPKIVALAGADPTLNQPIAPLNSAVIGYIDANGDGRPNDQSPDEPIYMDLDGSLTVTYGDLRLTPFASYGAGTNVDVANRDIGRTLSRATGWFATDASGAWFVDTDLSRTITSTDVRLGPSFTKVRTGDPASGQTLAQAQQQVSNGARVGYYDADNDGRRSLSDPLVLDLDAHNGATAGRATLGDIRIDSAGPGLDPAGSSGGSTGGSGDGAGPGGDGDGSGIDDAGDGEAEGGSGWGAPEMVLLVLFLVNLVGLAFVYKLAGGGSPRNPFK